MSVFGKLLVFVNLVLSMVLLTIAFGLYTQRIDWVGTSATKGEVAKLKEKLTSPAGLYDQLSSAETRFKLARTDLDGVAKVPAKNRQWYEAQIKTLEDPKPVMDLVYDNNRVALDDKGFPKLQAAKDRMGGGLVGVPQYRDQSKALLGQIEDDGKALAEAVKQESDLTDEIARPKGLRDLLAAEQYKVKQIKEEIEYLKPLWYNTLVEKELLVKRREVLELRKNELEKTKGLATR